MYFGFYADKITFIDVTSRRISISATLAAGVFLALHQISFSDSSSNREQAILASNACIEVLSSAEDYSLVARKGTSILCKLLKMEAELHASSVVLAPKEVVSALLSDTDAADTVFESTDPLSMNLENNWNAFDLMQWPLGFDLDGQIFTADLAEFDLSLAGNSVQQMRERPT